jgi:hypothetical protein
MPKRLRLTRRFPVALTNDAYRRLLAFAAEAGLTPDEALTFLFEHFGSVTRADNLGHRLRLFKAELAARRA